MKSTRAVILGLFLVACALSPTENLPADMTMPAQASAGPVVTAAMAAATGRPTPRPVARSSYGNSNSAAYVSFDGALAVGYADFSRDGCEDLLSANISGTTATTPIKLFLGSSTGSFTEDNSWLPSPVPGTVHARKIVIAAFNSDSAPDAFIVDHGYDQPPFPGAQPILLLSHQGRYQAVHIPNVPTGFQHSATAADINGDGMTDIFVTDTTNGAFVLLNDGDGNFSVTRHDIPSIKDGYYTSELIDLDGDGFYDLLVGGHEQAGAVTRVYWGDASSTYGVNRASPIPVDVDYRIVRDFDAADLDGDGTLELVVTRTKSKPFYQGYYFQILELDHRKFTDISGRITPDRTAWEGGTAHWVPWVMLRDFNNDGFVDIVVSDKSRGLVYHNNGSGNFKQAP